MFPHNREKNTKILQRFSSSKYKLIAQVKKIEHNKNLIWLSLGLMMLGSIGILLFASSAYALTPVMPVCEHWAEIGTIPTGVTIREPFIYTDIQAGPYERTTQNNSSPITQNDKNACLDYIANNIGENIPFDGVMIRCFAPRETPHHYHCFCNRVSRKISEPISGTNHFHYHAAFCFLPE